MCRTKDILILLAARRLILTPKLRRRVTECTDLAQLERWFRNAATAETLDAVFAAEPPHRTRKTGARRSDSPRSRARELSA